MEGILTHQAENTGDLLCAGLSGGITSRFMLLYQPDNYQR